MKKLIFEKNKVSELLQKPMVFVSCEEKPDYNNPSKINYIVTVLSLDANESITAMCTEQLPKEIKAMDRVDFMNAEIEFSGVGTSTFGTRINADLKMKITAQKCIKYAETASAK